MIEDLKANFTTWDSQRHSQTPQTEFDDDSYDCYAETGAPSYNGTEGDFDSAPFSSQAYWGQ
jgi:hypothetical protein